jgi:hypothetical protein
LGRVASLAVAGGFLLGCIPAAPAGISAAHAGTHVSLARPDLIATPLAPQPASVRAGRSFPVRDATKNVGARPARASTTRYYLSVDRRKSINDTRLKGRRFVRRLWPGGVSRGSVIVTIPNVTPARRYYRIACADAVKAVSESREANNCRASLRRILVAPSVSLYSSSSPFNKPIPPNANVDPNSDLYISSLVDAVNNRRFTISLKAWTVPVFYANAYTRRYNVRLTESWRAADYMLNAPIPKRASPDPAGDRHMTVLDRTTGCEFDFYRARKVNGRWSAGWANSIQTMSRGIYPHAYSTRGSGFSNLAGVMFPRELRRGAIKHALMFSYPYTSARGAVSPATETDGQSTRPDAIPTGARLQLDPSLNLDSLNLRPYERTIARALKKYGMYLGDTGGGVNLYAVHPKSYRVGAYKGVLPAETYPDLSRIPANRFRVVALGPIRTRAQLNAQARLVSSGCGAMR